MAVMRDEIEVTMKLLGVNKLDELGPHLVSLTVGLANRSSTRGHLTTRSLTAWNMDPRRGICRRRSNVRELHFGHF